MTDKTILYYINPKGKVAVSIDLGETIVIPSGKKMSPDKVPAWEEISEDFEGQLSPQQKKVVDDFLAQPPLTEIEQMAANLGKNLRHEKRTTKAPDPTPHKHVPESALVVCSEFDD